MAVAKLADFVTEFASVEEVVLLQSPRGDGTEDLRSELAERLGQSRPDLEFPAISFDAILACHIGPDAMGVVVYEGAQ
jgi:fatty acid-binding protein DegV